jgi:hypothetical protein
MGKKGVNFRQKNGNYKNGRTTERGYTKIRVYTHPFAPKDGYMRFHRYVLEIYYSIKFGFPVYILPKWFAVHHKNGNKKDNRIENLQLLSHSKHSTITNNERIYKRMDYTGTICLLCGSDKTSYSVRKGIKYYRWHHYKDGRICDSCYNKTLNNSPIRSDILKRICLLCNTNDPPKNKRGKPRWCKYKDGYICQPCYDKLEHPRTTNRIIRKPIKRKKKRIIVKPIRVCILCKSKISITGNRNLWYKFNKFDICKKCYGYKRRKYNNPFKDILSRIS